MWREKIWQWHLFACLTTVFPRLIKFDRAEKKLQEIKQELLSVFNNRESLKEKRDRERQWRCASCSVLTLRNVFNSLWNIQPSPEAFLARFYRELWRHREDRERLDNAEACYLYFSFHTASSVYSFSIKEANIPLSGSYAHDSNHE